MKEILYPEYRKWNPKRFRGGDGVLVGSDSAQEWLLPWWWDHYKRHNHHPVAWIDLGLSEKMKDWCRERGELIRLLIADIFVASKEEVAPSNVAYWERSDGMNFWNCRNAWFKKPFSILQTPFQRTLWIDSDCEIRGSIAPLFDLADHPSGLALRPEEFPSKKGDILYNSGVIPYRWGLPLIEQWASRAMDENHQFIGDQDVLSQILVDQKIEIGELPEIYNRSRLQTEEGALILHWHGLNGKKVIESKLIQQRLSYLSSCSIPTQESKD